LRQLLLRALSWNGEIDWSRAALDNCGGEKEGNHIDPNPAEKSRAGCKRHLVVYATGIQLAVWLSAGDVNGCQRFEQMLDVIPALPRFGTGRP
jgi:hypothetical protein